MLPLLARWTSHEISGAGLGDDVHALPPVLYLPPQAKNTCGAQRDADDLPEDVLVAVPADGRAGRVLGDEHVLEALWLQVRERGGL